MGISGLTSYIDRVLPGLGKRKELAAGGELSLIVDGSAFTHHVAKSIDWSIGSQYKKLTFECINLAKTLSGVARLQFVFDGNLPAYKVNERMERNQSKIDAIRRILPNSLIGSISTEAASVLPCFAIHVAVTALKASGYLVSVSEGEADSAIARISMQKKCSVLSQDSDFFMYDTYSYIPLDTIRGTDTIYFYEFTRNDLALSLGLPPTHLPILAILGGSDFLPSKEMDMIFASNPQLEVKLSNRVKWPQIIRMMKRVAHLEFNEAKQTIVSLFKEEYASKLEDAIDMACRHYNSDAIIKNIESPMTESANIEALTTDSTYSRQDLCKQMSEGIIHPKLIEIFDGIFWCHPMLENISKGSCWTTSGNIRQLLYTKIHPQLNVSEHIRGSSSMIVKSVSPLKNDQPVLAHQDTFYNLLEFDAKSVETIHHPIVLAVRNIIKNRSGSKIANYEIVSFLCSSLTTSHSHAPSLISIHLLAEIEVTLFSIFLLSQLVAPLLATDKFWTTLDSNEFHWCFAQCRRGASPRRLLTSKKKKNNVRYRQFLAMYNAVCTGLQEYIEFVFDYGADMDGVI